MKIRARWSISSSGFAIRPSTKRRAMKMARAVTIMALSLRLESRRAILMVEGRHRHREGKKEQGLSHGGRPSQRHPGRPPRPEPHPSAPPATGGASRQGHPHGDLLCLSAGPTDHRRLDQLTATLEASALGCWFETTGYPKNLRRWSPERFGKSGKSPVPCRPATLLCFVKQLWPCFQVGGRGRGRRSG